MQICQLAAKLVARTGRAAAAAAACVFLLLKPMAGHDLHHGHTLSFVYSRNVTNVK